MNESDEKRMAVGKKADDLGLILTKVGEEYQVHSGAADLDRPEFAAPSLAEIEEFLDRQVTDR